MVIGEINRLYRRYNCKFVSFWDELSFPTIKSVENIIDKLSKLDFKIEWNAVARGDLFKKEHQDLIRDLTPVGRRARGASSAV